MNLVYYFLGQNIYPLMSDNKLSKCGLIFKTLYQLIHMKILYVHTTQISTTAATYCYTTL